MTDYTELIKALRVCKAGTDCTCCPMYGEEEADDGVNSFCSARRAADAIEELQGQKDGWIEQERKVLIKSLPRWIPVTERLPEENVFVLICGDLYPNKHDGGIIAVSARMDWNYWRGFGRERNITHWMPLPAPPKEETE